MNYGTSTRFEPWRVLDMAERYFGPEGLGLETRSRGPDAVDLVGRPGLVQVKVQIVDGATEVFLATRGLDQEVRRFMVGIFEDVDLPGEPPEGQEQD